MSGLLVLGAGGHGRVVASAARKAGLWSEIAFLDDRFPEVEAVDGLPVLGGFEAATDLLAGFPEAIAALGDCHARLLLLRELREKGFCFPVLIHPSAWVSGWATLGAGTVVFAQSVLNPGATLGEACIVNTAATVDHDCEIGSGVHLSPGVHVGGNVFVGDCTWLGLGSNIKNGVRIGRDVVVGVGAAVISDLSDGVTAAGVPARLIRREQPTW